MNRARLTSVWCVGIVTVSSLALDAVAGPRGIRIDEGWGPFIYSMPANPFTPAAVTFGLAEGPSTLDITPPQGLDVFLAPSDTAYGAIAGYDAFDWCSGACPINFDSGAVNNADVLAQLWIQPYQPNDGIELYVYYQCADAFSLVADGMALPFPATCPAGDEFDGTYILSPNGTVSTPEPGTFALVAAALGCLGAMQLRWVRHNRGGRRAAL